MGLDMVELLMAVEDEFQLQIEDSAAEQLLTVGDLHRFLLAELPQADSDEVWEAVVTLTAEKLAIPRERVTPGATFLGDLGAD